MGDQDGLGDFNMEHSPRKRIIADKILDFGKDITGEEIDAGEIDGTGNLRNSLILVLLQLLADFFDDI